MPSWVQPAPPGAPGTGAGPAVRGPEPADRQPGWFRTRWGSLLAVLIGLGLLIASFVAPWFQATVDMTISTPLGQFSQSSSTQTYFYQVKPWGYAYPAVVVPLLVLTLTAVLLRQSPVRRWIGIAALAATLPALGVISAANAKVNPNGDGPVARLLELVRAAGDGGLSYYVDTAGLACALLGVLTLGMVAVAAAWPGAGRYAAATVGTVFVAVGIALPWVTVYGVTPGGVETRNVGWIEFGGPALLVVLTSLVLTGLVWWVVLRRSTSGRLPLLLLTLPLALLSSLLPDLVSLQAEDWMPGTERERFLHVETAIRSAAELIQLAPVLLGVAAVLGWRAARRRASAATAPAAGAVVG